jgi:hypothetical protein
MEQQKLRLIIQDKNEQREHVALRTAEAIIEAIVQNQRAIAKSQDAIAELRKELADLKVEQLDPASVLGE